MLIGHYKTDTTPKPVLLDVHVECREQSKLNT